MNTDEELMEQIRQLEEEIIQLVGMDSNARKHVLERTVARLEAAMAYLERGMKV